MKKIIYFCFLLFTFSLSANDIFKEMDRVFEQQGKMIEKLMEKNLRNMDFSLGDEKNIEITSKIKQIQGETYEVVSIKADPKVVSSLKVTVDKSIHISLKMKETRKTSHGSFSSTTEKSSSYPVPRNGLYKLDMTETHKGEYKLYFLVPKGKIAENWSLDQGFSGFQSFSGGLGGLEKLRKNFLKKFGVDSGNFLEELENEPPSKSQEDKGIVLPQRKI